MSSFFKDKEREKFENIWREALRQMPFHGHLKMTKTSGETIVLLTTILPMSDSEGSLDKIFLIAQSIPQELGKI